MMRYLCIGSLKGDAPPEENNKRGKLGLPHNSCFISNKMRNAVVGQKKATEVMFRLGGRNQMVLQ